MCLRKPRLHGGSVSREGLLQIWTQRRKGAFSENCLQFSLCWKPNLKPCQCISDVGTGPCIKTSNNTPCDGIQMHYSGNHIIYCSKMLWPSSCCCLWKGTENVFAKTTATRRFNVLRRVVANLTTTSERCLNSKNHFQIIFSPLKTKIENISVLFWCRSGSLH